MQDSQSDRLLQMSSEEMRAFGYQIVDMLIEHTEHLRDLPLSPRATRSMLEQRLREPLPEQGSAIPTVLAQLQDDVLANVMPMDHPRFFAFIPGPNNFVSTMADALASGFNIFAGTWMLAPGPAQVELVTIDWLRQLCGLPDTAGGLFVSGGSSAMLTALATARRIKLADEIADAVVYYSDQTHSSVARALHVLGFRPEQMRQLPSDEQYRLSVTVLRQTIAEDRAAGKRPFCVVANAGTTNTGAVDPLLEIGALCRNEDLWLHVDGAHGGAAILSECACVLLQGMEQADSLALDPHKWLFQPYEIGCVFTRERSWLYETYSVLPEILRDVAGREEEVNFRDYGLQLTRSSRALKLWMSLKVFGLAAFRQAITRGIELAEFAEKQLRAASCWEILTPAQLGIVTFRYRSFESDIVAQNLLNQQIIEASLQDGFAFLTSTTLRSRVALRLCIINPNTTEDDIRQTIERLEQFGRALSSSASTENLLL